MLCPVELTTRAGIAGTVNERGDPVNLRNGLAADMHLAVFEDADDMPVSHEAVPGSSRNFGRERGRDTADGIATAINGVFFTFDSVVAKSFALDRATNAGAEDDDLPLSGTGKNPASPSRKVMKVSANFNDHVKSVTDSKFQSPNSSNVNDWDLRDFRPPEWVMKLREMIRHRIPQQPSSSTSTSYASGNSYGSGYSYGAGYSDGTGEPDAESADNTSLLVMSANVFLIIQRKLEEMDSATIILIGMVTLPLVLMGVAWKTRDLVMPSRGTHRRSRRSHATSRPPTRVRVRVRKSRKSSDPIRAKTRLQN